MVWTGVTCLALAFALPAQAPPPPADTTLASITQRGRLLAGYDAAAWRASDAVAAGATPGSMEGFIARRGAGAWEVLFGRLTTGRDSFLVVATATEPETTGSRQLQLHNPPVVAATADLHAFRALRTASGAVSARPRVHNGTYNPYVLPNEDGTWWVYFLPAQVQQGVYPHGGDFRVVVSADGLTVLSIHQMHNVVLQLQVPRDAVAGMHSVVTDDLPQDSDVFLVLVRQPPKPELIATRYYNYHIHVDGTITWRASEYR
jgi:hypothetical protein